MEKLSEVTENRQRNLDILSVQKDAKRSAIVERDMEEGSTAEEVRCNRLFMMFQRWRQLVAEFTRVE